MNILFVCHSNINRSKTFETYFNKHYPNLQVRSAGCWFGNPYLADDVNLAWADIVYVMDLTHYRFIHDKYPAYIKKVQVIGIPDQFEYGDSALVELIELWIEDFNVFEK